MFSARTPSIRFSVALAVALHLLAAHFSAGALHPDEHFQLLEFLGFKLGFTDAASLPWEFGARLRPWLPVLFLRGIAGLWRSLGVDNPFIWAESFRFLAAGLAALASWSLVRCLKNESRRWAILAFAWIWFVPFLHARISSEATAASFFCLALPGVLLAPGGASFLSGLFLGLSFECRFQMGIMIVGLLVWRWKEGNRAGLGKAAAGFALVFIAGRLADLWGYGEWTLTPWNYLRANLVDGKATQWGTLPPWGYLYLIGRELFPLGALALIGLFAFWWRQPRHVFTWITLPFFLVHSLIAHKEARFLVPIAWMLPAMLPLALEGLAARWPTRPLARMMFALILAPLLALNFSALLWLSFKPARSDALLWQRAYAQFPDGFRYTPGPGEGPYEWGQLPVHFFRPRGPVESGPRERYVFLRAPWWLNEGDASEFEGRSCHVLIDSLGPLERWVASPKLFPSRRAPTLLDCAL